jgi:hypothetical protein
MTKYPNIILKKAYGPGVKSDWWKLVESVSVPYPLGEYVIPEGYTTDFISGPWVVYPLIHPHGAGANEAIPHDYEHENGIGGDLIGRQHARLLSNLMLAVRMTVSKAPRWKIWCMLIYTCLFSWVRFAPEKKV